MNLIAPQAPIRAFNPDGLHAPRTFAPLDSHFLQQPLVLEIGAGKGKHALVFAQHHPQLHLLAVERTTEKYQVMQQRAMALGLPNISCVHADAIAWAVYALPPHSLQAIYILYPNPEPKNAAQRWLNMPFFSFLLSRLQPMGTITLASNIPSYINEAQARLQHTWQLPFSLSSINNTPELVAQPRTHFEVKYLARNEACQQLEIIKPEQYVTPFDSYTKLICAGS